MPFRVGCCYAPRSYVILTRFFVKLLVLKGLASEPQPIDRKRTGSKVCLRYSPSHRYQPDLRILTRSTGSPPARDLPCRRLLHPGVSNSRPERPDGGRGVAQRVFLPSVHRLPPVQASPRGLGIRAKGILGPCHCPPRR